MNVNSLEIVHKNTYYLVVHDPQTHLHYIPLHPILQIPAILNPKTVQIENIPSTVLLFKEFPQTTSIDELKFNASNQFFSFYEFLFFLRPENTNSFHFTPLEYSKAIYGIGQALKFAQDNQLHFSLSDLYFNSQKQPFIAFSTPLLIQQKLVESNSESDQYLFHVYQPNDLSYAFQHIIYFLAYLTFETKETTPSATTQENIDAPPTNQRTDNASNVNDPKKTAETDEAENEEEDLNQENDGPPNHEIHIKYHINKIINLFLRENMIIRRTSQQFPEFIHYIIKKCVFSTVTLDWIIDQLSYNAAFILDHGPNAQLLLDDPATKESILAFQEYASTFTKQEVKVNSVDDESFRSSVLQENLPYEMDPWIYSQAQSIIELQDILMNISSDTLEESFSLFLDSIYFTDVHLIESLVHYIIIAVFHRPKNIESITLLIKQILEYCESEKVEKGKEYASKLKETLLLMIPEKPASAGFYGNANGPLYFLYQCYKHNIFSDKDICDLTRRLVDLHEPLDEPSVLHLLIAIRPVVYHIVAYFVPQLYNNDKNLLKFILNNERIEAPKNYHQVYLRIFQIINFVEENGPSNWELYDTLIYNPNGIREILERDDCDALRSLAVAPDFNLNARLDPCLFTGLHLICDYPTLIQYAAFCGSLNCFRYLFLNGADTKLADNIHQTLVHYAISGGSIEIVRFCEQENMNFEGALEETVKMYQFEIFDYLRDTKFPELPSNNLEYGSIATNAARTNNMSMLMLSLENQLDPNASDSNGISFLYY